MSDLHEELNAYIDAIADPVTVAEATNGRLRRAVSRPPRWRVAAAVAAGAAIVLVPALVIAVLRLFPSDDVVAAPSTSSAGATTMVEDTTTTTVVAPTVVAVPDVVGLTAMDATELLLGAGFQVDASGDPNDLAVVASQNPAPGTEVDPGTTVSIEIAPYAPVCREGWAPTLPPPAPGEVEITVLFDCANETDAPNVVTPLVRRVEGTVDPIGATLEALLEGPTAEERAAGFGSFFSAETAGALEALAVEGGLAVVDFNDAIYVNNASTSTGSEFFLAELTANLFQFDQIDRIEFRVDGRCEAFWNWLQRECSMVTREGPSDELPFGPCSAASSSTPLEDPAIGLPEPVATSQALLLSLAVRCDMQTLDALAAEDETSIVLTHLFVGDTPFTTLEASLEGAPAVALVETLGYPSGVSVDGDGVDVYVWPEVAVPGFDWGGLTDGEIAALSGRYGEGAVMFSIDGGIWVGFSVEIDESGRWRSFGQPLT